MTTVFVGPFLKAMNPGRLTGPIFDKELRVSSRRRRNYVLRFVYLLLLTVFMGFVWLVAVGLQADQSLAGQVAKTSLAGIIIVNAIIGFQFLATQLLAIIMLSNSISDEIYKRTLGILMTTPINGFQIVMGKLFSKLLQLVILLAISLPLLATVRVFGGVPWDCVLSGLCITLTAAIFAGALSLYFSISSKRAYHVVLKTVFTLGILFGFVPAIVAGVLLRQGITPTGLLYSIAGLLNPFAAFSLNTGAASLIGVARWMRVYPWPYHCAIMLFASGLILARSVMIVRKVALRQAAGELQLGPRRRLRKNRSPNCRGQLPQSTGPIKRVKGPCVIWKELRAPSIKGPDETNGIIGLGVAIVALMATYAVCIKENCLHEAFAHVGYVTMFICLGVGVNIALSAAAITREKETQCWPILLATPLGDWNILLAKAVSVVRRCLPIWLLLGGHVVFFVVLRYIHPVALVHLVLLVIWVVVFLCGSGLYFSSRFKRTTSAVVANFALALVLWAFIPILLGISSQITRDEDVLEAYVSAHPIVQASVVMRGAGGEYNASKPFNFLRYRWPCRANAKFWDTTGLQLICVLIYTSLGLLFGWRAKCRFRRNVF
ncbi:MAG: ABC transporter permease [Planctomycetota bacterium]|jgi:ABC-type transport system involved in multi-copper enzyme maturation permease subunit